MSSTTIIPRRVTARVPDDGFAVFLIGMRLNRPLKVHKWWPVARAMGRMLRELDTAPDIGLRHVEAWFGRTTLMIQYWESFAALERYATATEHTHLPAWRDFNRAVGEGGDVGIWHETYLITPGRFECVYNNMPRFGLSRAFETVPATGAYARAASRLAAGGTHGNRQVRP